MRTLRAWLVRLAATVRSTHRDRALADELNGHLEMAIEDNVRAGMTREEARRLALIALGGVAQTEEGCRERRGIAWLEGFLRDMRFGFRTLRKTPAFTTIAVLTLAFGIGAMTAMFSIVNGVLLRPLPYRDASRLYVIREIIPELSQQFPTFPVNRPQAYEWRDRVKSFERLAVLWGTQVVLTGRGEPERLGAARVTATLFDVAGVRPVLGRTFSGDEEQPGHDVVVISDALWSRRFNRDSGVLGQSLVLDGRLYTILGVLPADFWFPRNTELGAGNPQFSARTDVFFPTGPRPGLNEEGDFSYGAVAKLRDNVTFAQAQSELTSVQAAFAAHLKDNLRPRAVLLPLHDVVTGSDSRGLWLLLAAMGGVLLIICINLGSLVLVRVIGRERDTAIRGALGASRPQLMRSVVAETICLVLIGGALGFPIAIAATTILVTLAPVNIPLLDRVSIDASVAGVAGIIMAMSAVVCAMIPAWAAMRMSPRDLLGTRHALGARVRARTVMVGAEIALTTCLLIVSGLLAQSFIRLMNVNRGFEVERIATLDVTIPQARYQTAVEEKQFFEEALRRVGSVPGVSASGLISKLPLRGEDWVDILSVEGDSRPPLARPFADYRWTSPGYFRTVGIPIVRGRGLQESDAIGRTPGIVVSRRVADELWPGQEAVGQQIHRSDDQPTRFTVVGIAGDALTAGLQEPPRRVIYIPMNLFPEQGFPLTMSFVFRTAGDPAAIASDIRQRIRTLDAELPVPPMVTMQEIVDTSVASRRFQSVLAAGFATVGLLLALLGIYGALSYTTSLRTRELGLRLALGARRGEILREVLGQGGRVAAAGVALGIAVSLGVTRLIGSLLFGVSASDPVTFAAVSALMLATMLTACLLPARQATRVEPLTALRYE